MSNHIQFLEMPAVQAKRLQQSYGRCCLDTGFLDTFYELFLASSPEVSELFAKTDMDRQKKMLKISLAWMVMTGSGNEYAYKVVIDHAERHSRRSLGVQPHLYDLWFTSLMTAIEKHDPSFSQELDGIWRNCLASAIEVMKSRY